MKKIIVPILICVFTNFLNAQVLQEKNTAYKLVNGQIIKNDLTNSYEGTSYISEFFLDAKIFANEKSYEAKLRYNAYLDEMEIEEGISKYYLKKDNNMIITFYDQNETYQLLNYTLKDKQINGYLKLLLKNKYSLLKREKIELVDANTNTGAFKTENYNDYDKKYSRVKDMYFIKDGDSFHVFPNQIKKLKELFKTVPDLDKYYKNNNLDLNLEKDKITILNYINKQLN